MPNRKGLPVALKTAKEKLSQLHLKLLKDEKYYLRNLCGKTIAQLG